MHDLVIRGGRIIDGTGAPAYEGDVAIEAARTALVGDAEEQRERRRRLEVTLAQIQAQHGEPEAATTDE